MSRSKEDSEISDEERIKNLEVKADKVEDLLTMNICFSIIGCMVFMIVHIFQSINPFNQNEPGLVWNNFVFIGLFVVYGILNVLILSKKKQEVPKID